MYANTNTFLHANTGTCASTSTILINGSGVAL
jgi:hypothetical protein